MDIQKEIKAAKNNEGLIACLTWAIEESKNDENLKAAIDKCNGSSSELWTYVVDFARNEAKNNVFCDPTGKKVFEVVKEFFVDYEAIQKKKEEAKAKEEKKAEERKKRDAEALKEIKEKTEVKKQENKVEPKVEPKIAKPEQLDLFEGFNW